MNDTTGAGPTGPMGSTDSGPGPAEGTASPAAATQVLEVNSAAAQARMADVHAYVTAVRSWLSDLPSDEVEDLTAGMEADLAERAAETGERLGVLLGEPEAYAAELRAAAGLAPRAQVVGAGPTGPGLVETMVTLLRAKGDGILARWPWLRELRPTWWLARGAALGWLLSGRQSGLLLPALGAAVSLWIGLVLRSREPLPRVGRVSLASANALAAILILPMVAVVTIGGSANLEEDMAWLPSEATANGDVLQNVFAYDAAGNRVDGVRLFDQAGRPIQVDRNQLSGEEFADVPWSDDGWPDVAPDVFPLRWAGHDAWADPRMPWMPPLVLAPVPALSPSTAVSPTPTASPSASPSPSPSASASASAGATSNPSANESPGSAASGTPSPSPTVTPSPTP